MCDDGAGAVAAGGFADECYCFYIDGGVGGGSAGAVHDGDIGAGCGGVCAASYMHRVLRCHDGVLGRFA